MIQESSAGLTVKSFDDDIPYTHTWSNEDDEYDEYGTDLVQEQGDNQTEYTRERNETSRNINVIMIYTYIAFVSRSLWNSNALSIFVFLLVNVDDKKTVGFITGLTGLTQLLSSYPASFVADKYRRDNVVKFGSIIGFISIFFTLYAAQKENLTLLAIGLSCYGISQGIVNPSVWALLADSVSKGGRSLYFTKRLQLEFYGRTTGPVLSLILFWKLGIEEWTIDVCAALIKMGQFVSIIELLCLYFVSDDYCVIDKSTHLPNVEMKKQQPDKDSIKFENSTESLLAMEQQNQGVNKQTRICCWSLYLHRIVPICVAVADLIGGISIGMSVRYFPIFFADNLNLSPNAVQFISLVTNLLLSWASYLGQYFGVRIGRLETSIIMKFIGCFTMFGMISSYSNGMSNMLVIVLYLIRTATVMGTGALTRSVLMDHVPKNERSRWNSVEAVTNFSWAGSAVLGGLLVDAKGLLYVFSFSSWCVLFSTIPYAIAIWIGVARETI
ncbi:hypothetical protein CTEN210_00900 [Chaetoceros tenuissimus]|uniref:Major facilitator superfamily (MFS) profile domain-containing protein n=1 Tax=Chaetoceros tenuissimus TaxID=426638 RepID=A0AAD3CEP2_9STRA|nr:hypothetical protein CTEN210_00900 [Chaetoceros tenuissimus]